MQAFFLESWVLTCGAVYSGGAALTIAHSGYLLDGADAPLSSAGGLLMKFRIYDQSGGSGPPQWEGTCATVQVVRGYYTVLLGSTACPGTMDDPNTTLDTSDLPTTGERWLEVEVGGVTMSPRMAIATVPTAAVASRALTADSLGTNAASAFAPADHVHAIDGVTDLQAALDEKLSAATVAQASAGTSPSVTCGSLTAGTLWYDSAAFALKVCNGSSYIVSTPPGPPGAPTVSSSNGALAVSWSAVAGAVSYEVGYAVGYAVGGSATVVPVASVISTTISGLTNGTAYAVAVRSVAGTWKSAWSAVTTGMPCSTGYVLVPQTTLPGGFVMAPFCVMQFEAKNVSGAVSQASGTPWVSVTWTAAKAACTAADNKHLITENEWLAIANNAANEGSNWTNSIVGNGKLFLGNNISSAALDGSDPLSGDQRRTLTLSNGAVVWDLAGNVWEWTDQTISATLRWHNGRGGMEYPVATDLPREKRPPDLSWDWNQGMGRYYPSGPAAESAFLRGGSWFSAAYAGVFLLLLGAGRAYSYSVIGFRCAGP